MPSRNQSNPRRAALSRLFFTCAGILLIVVAIALCYMALRNWENRQSAQTIAENVKIKEEESTDIEYNGVTYQLKDNIETILVMGIDKYQEDVDLESQNEDIVRNHQQADFISLVVMDKDEGTSRILQLNRDTMVNIQNYDIFGRKAGTSYEQLALAHTYRSGSSDSCRNVAWAVSDLLGGIQIDHFVSLTMDAVAELNDAIGGVAVTVTDDFSAVDPTLVQGETVTLYGQQALTYVRSRMSVDDGSNLSRMRRQQQYLNALYDKLAEDAITDESFFLDLVFKISPYMVSDCSVQKLSEILTYALENKTGDIETIDGKAEKGDKYIEFTPDKDALMKTILSLFYEPVSKS